MFLYTQYVPSNTGCLVHVSQYKLDFHIFCAPNSKLTKFWILSHFEHFHTSSQIFVLLFIWWYTMPEVPYWFSDCDQYFRRCFKHKMSILNLEFAHWAVEDSIQIICSKVHIFYFQVQMMHWPRNLPFLNSSLSNS